MADSIAENIFREWTGEGSAEILSALPTRTPKFHEDAFVEFKSGFVKEEDFPRIWSEVIGAFANTGGGVVVWGIGAAYDAEKKVDAASTLQFVPDVDAFTTRLKKAAQSNVDPPLPNLGIHPVIAKQGTREGFVVCYIPEGKHKPYESLRAEKRFYMRFDDRCEKVPLPALRLLFTPNLDTRAEAQVNACRSVHEEKPFLSITLSVINNGLNSIESPCLSFHSEGSGLFVLDKGLVFGAPNFFPLSPTLLHPGMSATTRVLAERLDEFLNREQFRAVLYQRNNRPKEVSFVYDYLREEFYNDVDVLGRRLKLSFIEA